MVCLASPTSIITKYEITLLEAHFATDEFPFYGRSKVKRIKCDVLYFDICTLRFYPVSAFLLPLFVNLRCQVFEVVPL